MATDRSNCQLRNYASTEEILGIVTQYIDVTDESQVLTHHGLDSITAVRLQTAIAAALGVRLPLVDFLGEATVQSLVDSLNASEIPVAPEPARPEESDISVAEEVLSGPLTPTQAMYWVGRQSDYPLGGYSTRFYAEYEIPFGGDASLANSKEALVASFQEAWNRAVNRHGMLRATVDRNGIQHIHPEVVVHAVPVNETSVEQVRKRLVRRVPDLHQWPVHDVEITCDPETESSPGVLTVHFGFEVVLIDFPGIMRVLDDIARFLRGGNPENEQDTPDDAGVIEQNFPRMVSMLEKNTSKDLEFWQRKAPNLPAGPLPASWVTTAMELAQAGTVEFVRHQKILSQAHWQAFCANAFRFGASPSGALMAVAAHALRAVGCPAEFGVATTFFDGTTLDHSPVGDYTRTGIVAVPRGSRSFSEQAVEATEGLWAALDHASVTSAEIVKMRSPEQQRDFPVEYPVVFTSAVGHRAAKGGWDIPMSFGVSQTPQVVMDLLHWEEAGKLVLAWDCIDAALPADFADSAITIAEAAIIELSEESAWADPARCSDPWMRKTTPSAASEKLPQPGEHMDSTIDAPLRSQAEADRDATAIIAVDGKYSRGDLQKRAEAYSAAVGELAGDEPVLVIMRKSCEQIAAIVGVVRAGGAYIPVDPSWPIERMEAIVRRSQAQLCIADEGVGFPEDLTRVVPRPVCTSHPADDPSRQVPAPEVDPSDLAYVIFTSGSTGEPKGVAIEHRQARTTIDDVNERFSLNSHDVALGVSALSFDLSVWDVFGVLGAGGTLVLPDESRLRDPSYWLELIESRGVTVWNSAPPLLEMLVDYAEIDPVRAQRSLKSLRLVMLSGDWIPVTLPRRLRQLAPNAVVYSLGGATEASIWSIHHRITPDDEFEPSIPYGKALGNQWFRILDESGNPAPVRTPGYLYIGGEGVARGYLGDPQKTAERFAIHDVLGERLYNTGDMGMWLPNGDIRFLGRVDRQVKINGYRIELGEIDAALARCADVKSAVCAAPTDQNGRRRLVAHVVPANAESFDDQLLREHLHSLLPSYMVPSRFVIHSQLPMNGNGKVDHKALPNPWQADDSVTPSDTESEESPAATTHAGMSEETQALPAASRSALTPTELGISSLDIVRTINRIEDATGSRPLLSDVLSDPWEKTLALATKHEHTEQKESGTPVEAPVTMPTPQTDVASSHDLLLSGIELGMSFRASLPETEEPLEEQFLKAGQWLRTLRQNLPESARLEATASGVNLCDLTIDSPQSVEGSIESTRNADQPLAHRAALTPLQVGYLVGRADTWLGQSVAPHYFTEVDIVDLDIQRLQRALDAVCDIHPEMELTVLKDGIQGTDPNCRPGIVCHRTTTTEEFETELRRVRERMRTGAADPSGQPWLSIEVVAPSQGSKRLFLAIDMLFCDVIGAQVLVEDLLSAYHGKALSTPEGSFLEFANRIAENGATKVIQQKQKTQDSAPVVLPLSRSTSGRFKRHRTTIEGHIARGIEQRAAELGATVDSVIAAAISTSVGAITGSEPQPIVATVLARPRGHERTIGEYTTTAIVDGGSASYPDRAVAAMHVLINAADDAMRGRHHAPAATMIPPIVYSSGLGSGGDQSELLGAFGTTVDAISSTPQVLIDVQFFRHQDGYAIVIDHAVDALQEGTAHGLMTALSSLLRYIADPTHDLSDSRALGDATVAELAEMLTPVSVSWHAFSPHNPQESSERGPSSVGGSSTSEARTRKVASGAGKNTADAMKQHIARALGQAAGTHVSPADYDRGFFDLGANSVDLIAMRNQLVSEGNALTLLDVFTHPSISALAAYLSSGVGGEELVEGNAASSIKLAKNNEENSTRAHSSARARGRNRRRTALAMMGEI